MHSVMNTLYAPLALKGELSKNSKLDIYEMLSKEDNAKMRTKIEKVALENGMIFIPDESGTNINVQIFDTCKLKAGDNHFCDVSVPEEKRPVLIVMDYAFGEQAYESLQNRDILKFFHDSTWNVIGLEMEGAHYQKAIQAASKLRGNIQEDVKVLYAYYASDNPLETGSTLASGGLGATGVKPTYLITEKILYYIFKI